MTSQDALIRFRGKIVKKIDWTHKGWCCVIHFTDGSSIQIGVHKEQIIGVITNEVIKED